MTFSLFMLLYFLGIILSGIGWSAFLHSQEKWVEYKDDDKLHEETKAAIGFSSLWPLGLGFLFFGSVFKYGGLGLLWLVKNVKWRNE
jgi:hypothetical protein